MEASGRVTFTCNKQIVEIQQPTTNLDAVVSVVVVAPSTSTQSQEMTAKEKKDRKAENYMFFMALTLSTISIVSRLLASFIYIYDFLFYTSDAAFIVPLIFYSIQTLGPTTCICVFYFFNKTFRQEFKRTLSRFKCKLVIKISFRK